VFNLAHPKDEPAATTRKRIFFFPPGRANGWLLGFWRAMFRPKPMPPQDTEQARWFVTEVQPHRPALRAWLLARFPTLPDVDDVVQESLNRTLRVREAGPVGSARALLFTTARNLALDAVRRQQVVSFEPITDDTPSSVLADGTDVVATVSKQQELELLTRAIQSLPERCRQVFTLRTAYGLTQKEIAARLGVSLSTVEKQMAQGIQLCAEYFARGTR
jgi:RNA polymerase sigma-70 factor (ECF subfamily)